MIGVAVPTAFPGTKQAVVEETRAGHTQRLLTPVLRGEYLDGFQMGISARWENWSAGAAPPKLDSSWNPAAGQRQGC